MSNWQESKIKKVLDIITVMSLLVGGLIGYRAYIEYKSANIINAESTLLNMDKGIYQKILGKPYLHAIFAKIPENNNTLVGLNSLLQLLLEEKKGKGELSFKWKNIPELYEKLFQADGFNRPDRVRLREAYFLEEDFLYLLLNCYGNKIESMISDEVFKTWIAYFSEIGQHPLFLSAIYCGHKYGYIDPKFSAFIVDLMKKSNRLTTTLKNVYPDMLSDNWAQRAGVEAGK